MSKDFGGDLMKKRISMLVIAVLFLTIATPIQAASDKGLEKVLTNLVKNDNMKGRILWYDLSANIHNLDTPEKVRDIVTKTANANIDTIVLDVKNYTGFVGYNSEIAPHMSTSNISNYSDLSFEVFLYTRRTSIGLIEFYSLQRSVIMFFDELGLVFFRLYNPLNHAYINFFIYLVYPLLYSVYVHKIQCFCFESIVINSFEVLDLPVLFSISSDIRFEWMFSFCRLALLYIHFAG